MTQGENKLHELTSQELNQRSLRSFKQLFASLAPPDLLSIQGVHQAEFVGPAWLRRSAGPLLALGGLQNWWGKEFDGSGGGKNIVRRRGSLERVLPMEIQERVSLVDARPGVALTYPPGSRFPWPRFVDELRQLSEGRLLGLGVMNVRWLRKLAFPFLLHSREHVDGL